MFFAFALFRLFQDWRAARAPQAAPILSHKPSEPSLGRLKDRL